MAAIKIVNENGLSFHRVKVLGPIMAKLAESWDNLISELFLRYSRSLGIVLIRLRSMIGTLFCVTKIG